MISRRPWGGLAVDSEAEPGRAPDVVVLGVPWDGSVCFRAGAAEAPARLRAISHTSPAISERGEVVLPERFSVRDAGDVVVVPRKDAHEEEPWRAAYLERVREAFCTAFASDQHATARPFVLSLGGDHSVSIPLIRGFAGVVAQPIGVVLLDAHPDLFDSYEGSSLSHACPMRRALETGQLSPQHLVIVGTRSYNAEELAFMREQGIRFVPAADLNARGVEAVVTEVRQRLSGVEHVYLTLDIDVADPACAPGTGAPVAGGLSSRQTLDLVRGLLEGLPVHAMDIVEIAPPLDPTDVTLFLGLQIVFEAFAVLAAKRGALAG